MLLAGNLIFELFCYFAILRIKRNLFKETIPPEQEQEKTEDTP